jgi:NADH-quinone oxidoreductase subunit L
LVTGPLLLLALLSIVGGLVGLPAWTGATNHLEHFLEPSFRYQLAVPAVFHPHSEEILLMLVAIAFAATGIFVAWRFYIARPGLADRVAERFPILHFIFEGKFFIDEIYDLLIVGPLKGISSGLLWKRIDSGLIDGSVNGIASLCRGAGGVLRLLQTGQVRAYAACILGGASLLALYYLAVL